MGKGEHNAAEEHGLERGLAWAWSPVPGSWTLMNGEA